MHFKKLFVISLLTLALLPTTASAQNWFITPFIGTNFSADANFFGDFEGIEDDDFVSRIDAGVTAGWNPGFVGFEVDLGWSPKFFNSPVLGSLEPEQSYLLTFMGNVLVTAPPATTIRPYGSAGLGLIRTGVGSSEGEFGKFADNKWGWDIGGGVTGNFSDNMGVRGDIRYFREIEANDIDEFDVTFSKLKFWRATVGLEFRW